MTAVALTLYPTRSVEEPVPEVTAPVMVELDQVIESTTRRRPCSTPTAGATNSTTSTSPTPVSSRAPAR